ncbi:uncharacterized protein LOC128642605 [Bombina bombina]|uniref:uncharacterized protein LOC128642605 n=1 Tax=Bombina bombina TaxID=8345 RepID=UPI00235A7500|nr:uncharacterized protein LOC128642605 [Bombina bombina]
MKHATAICHYQHLSYVLLVIKNNTVRIKSLGRHSTEGTTFPGYLQQEAAHTQQLKKPLTLHLYLPSARPVDEPDDIGSEDRLFENQAKGGHACISRQNTIFQGSHKDLQTGGRGHTAHTDSFRRPDIHPHPGGRSLHPSGQQSSSKPAEVFIQAGRSLYPDGIFYLHPSSIFYLHPSGAERVHLQDIRRGAFSSSDAQRRMTFPFKEPEESHRGDPQCQSANYIQ